MEERVRRYTILSVARGCAFGFLAIFTLMVGSASELTLFFRSGGIGLMLMCFILLLKASRVDQVPVRSTEVWIMMDEHERPPQAIAKVLIARARREALQRFALVCAIAGGGSLALDAVFLFFRIS